MKHCYVVQWLEAVLNTTLIEHKLFVQPQHSSLDILSEVNDIFISHNVLIMKMH